MLKRHRREDAGFGTTLGLVLVIIAISLMITLGADVVGRGSRGSIQRAFGGSRALAVADQALDEAFTSRENQQKLIAAMVSSLGTRGVTPLRPAPTMEYFVGLLNPIRTGSPLAYRDPDEDPAANQITRNLLLVDGPANTVTFPGLAAVTANITTFEKAYQDEISRGIVRLSPVMLRPVLYSYAGPVDGSTIRCGSGLARAMVTVTYRLEKRTYAHRVTQERRFDVYRDGENAYSAIPSADPWRKEILN